MCVACKKKTHFEEFIKPNSIGNGSIFVLFVLEEKERCDSHVKKGRVRVVPAH